VDEGKICGLAEAHPEKKMRDAGSSWKAVSQRARVPKSGIIGQLGQFGAMMERSKP
jgi:hypothetical protein